MGELNELLRKIKKFRDDRDWMQFHNHKDMAIGLAMEAAEVMEHFHWKTREEMESYVKAHKDEIGEELADVAIYILEMADNLGINLAKAIENKLEKNCKKYPVDKAKGNHKKYTEF